MQEMEARQIRNDILRCIPADLLSQLSASWKWISLTPHEVLKRDGEMPRSLYFLNAGLVSFAKPMADGRTAEIGAVGIDGMVGIFALYSQTAPSWEAVVQMPGHAIRLDVAVVGNLMDRDDRLRRILESYLNLVAAQLAQNAVCNRLHSMEQRFARRLLVAHDSAESDTILLTHESLAQMLGVQRAGLSITAAAFQRAGLIRYTRGRVTIIDRAGIEDVACECYRMLRSEPGRLFGNSRHKAA
jgi:CRP-like cAMP-binding protein